MERFRIATVIPLYNGSRYIRQAIDSVLGQTRRSDRLVVVDDGSSDDGAKVVAAAFPHHALEIVHTANGGQSRARNIGVGAVADCDLVAFLDQDDIWYPEHLQMLEQTFLDAASPRLAYAYSNLDQIDLAGRRIHQSVLDLVAGPRQKTKLHELIGLDVFVLPSASLVRRDAFMAVGGFDEQLSGYEDDDLFLRLFLAGYDHAYVPTSLSQWRIFGESCSQSPRMRRSRVRYALKLIDMFPKEPQLGTDMPRDIVWPRFSRTLLNEIKLAVRRNDSTVVCELVNDFSQIAKAADSYDLRTRLKVRKVLTKAMFRAA